MCTRSPAGGIGIPGRGGGFAPNADGRPADDDGPADERVPTSERVTTDGRVPTDDRVPADDRMPTDDGSAPSGVASCGFATRVTDSGALTTTRIGAS